MTTRIKQRFHKAVCLLASTWSKLLRLFYNSLVGIYSSL